MPKRKVEIMDASEKSFRTLIDNLYDGVYYVDRQRTIQYWNKAAEKITGYKSQQVVGKRCSDNILTHVDHEGNILCQGMCPLAETISDGSPREAEVYLHHKAGHRVPVSIRATPIRDDQGSIIGAVELFADISSKEATLLRMKELESRALLDHLTQLANRQFVEMELVNRLEEKKRYGWPFGILFLDIDDFKKINDTYGHDMGDAVLKSVSNTFTSNARPFDLFGRWGGEEFLGILKNVNGKILYDIGKRLRLLIKESYLMVDGKKIQVTVSMGGTLARRDDTKDTLVRRADRLMYKSKEGGKNRFTIDFDNTLS
jgi:diguanylate cyclase (GGDEF)-like protein/PAS domain S-box-containing protein